VYRSFDDALRAHRAVLGLLARFVVAHFRTFVENAPPPEP
jgi:hypothetical protein